MIVGQSSVPSFSAFRPQGTWTRRTFCLAVLMALANATVLFAQAPQIDATQRAAMILNSARVAFNQQQYPFAAQRFDEYLKEFAALPEAQSARLGWGLALLEGPVAADPQAPVRQAIEVLNGPAGDKNFADRPLALYYQGLAFRRLGHLYLQMADAQPNEAPQRINEANAMFTQALPKFAESLAAFEARAAINAAKPADPKPAAAPAAPALADDLQWAARARCDQAEMLLRLAKVKEAFDLTVPFTVDATPAAQSRYRPLGLYCHGHAAFLLNDQIGAGRALSRLVPFNQPAFGNHARYLLARTHHLAGERAEALKLYKVVDGAYQAEKAAAQQMLANPETFKNNPAGKAAAEAFVAFPPDYVSRGALYTAVLLYEQELFADALARLVDFEKLQPKSPQHAEAQLRRGMCQVQLKQWPEALATLALVVPHPVLGDRALLWLARAQIGRADPAQPQQVAQVLNEGAASFRQAIERGGQLLQTDPEAKLRRVECLLELGDVQMRLQQFAEAVGSYETIVRERHDVPRLEETLPRLATAYYQAQRFDDADRVCREFQGAYPQSSLLPAVLFRYGEVAFARAKLTDPGKPLAQSPQRKPLLEETKKRFAPLLANFPEFESVAVANYRLGMALAELGEYEAAVKALAAIADADRTGELAPAGYHQADAVLHLLPDEAGEDALATARIIEQLGQATKLLEGYVANAGQTKPAELPDALLKLGYCYHRSAELIAQPELRAEALTKGRAACERVMNEFNTTPQFATAIYERAKIIVAQGDPNSGINELNRFRADPLKQATIAPLALLREATLMRAANRIPEAVTVLAECRAAHEPTLRNDPTRVAWVPLILYHHGLALRAAGNLPEARTTFEAIATGFPNWPQLPDALWRAGQCTQEEALARLTAARTLRAKAGATPPELAQAQGEIQASVDSLRKVAEFFRTHATATGQKSPGSAAHQQLLYAAAWCNRTVAEEEVEAARRQLAEQKRQQRQQELTAKNQAAQLPVPNAALPEITLTEIPAPATEKTARQQYEALIAAGDASPLALRARLELAEMQVARKEVQPAAALVTDALDLEPPADLEQPMRLVLGDCLMAQGQHAAARDQLLAVAAVEASPLAALARYRAGECSLALKEYPKAIEILLPLRDHGPLQNVAGVSDRALLRLGHAYAAAGQWDQSRYTMEVLLGRFPASNWRFEARYGFAWALQNMQQWDGACQHYEQVARETAGEVAARAQLQVGRCRFAQSRFEEALKAMLTVPSTYDYAEWNAAALYDASRTYDQLKQPAEATKQLQRLLNEYPQSPWIEPAKERLAKLASN